MRLVAIMLLFVSAGMARAVDDAAQAPAPIASAPIDLTDNRVEVHMTAAGVPVKLLLDTGASTSLLFESDALNKAELTFTEERHISFPAFAKGATGARISALTFSAVPDFTTTSDTVLYLKADEGIVADIGTKFSGILGRDFLRNYVVEIVPPTG
ncbi:aspartyl protease family protein [Kordiimonas gwangyangensis]|uniref:aspartyl protease family protein n=1 Tax=Kordiimonas gwangyangensis TaxID=288022 RepID=UPI00046EB9D4|nr:aspartyl protease family protein [Kordiimonas gwangyangensis]